MRFTEAINANEDFDWGKETKKPLFLHAEENRPTELIMASSPDESAHDLPIHVVLEQPLELGRKENHDRERELQCLSHIHVVVGGTQNMVKYHYSLTKPRVVSVQGYDAKKIAHKPQIKGGTVIMNHDDIARPSEIWLQNAPSNIAFKQRVHVVLTENNPGCNHGLDCHDRDTRLSTRDMRIFIGGTRKKIESIIPDATHIVPLLALDFRKFDRFDIGKPSDFTSEIEQLRRELQEIERLKAE